MKKIVLMLVLMAGVVGMAHAGNYDAQMKAQNLELDGNLAGSYDGDC